MPATRGLPRRRALGHGPVQRSCRPLWGTPSRSWTVTRPAPGREIRRSASHLHETPEIRTICCCTVLFQTSGRSSRRVLSPEVLLREYRPSWRRYLEGILSSDLANCKEFSAQTNWRRSFFTHAPRKNKRAETIIVILPVAGRGISSDLSPRCQGPNRCHG